MFDGRDIDESLAQFTKATRGVCGLASRYDGIDLPGESCRLVVLWGLPDGNTLLERFMSGRARAGLALGERIRTRVVQGAGRCTRGPSDLAVVVVCGSELSKYFLRPLTREALDPEIQAEIQFGLDNSRVEVSELMGNLEEFLQQGRGWLLDAEEDLSDRRRSARMHTAPGSEVLAKSAELEVAACSEAWSGRWEIASGKLEEAATLIGQGGESTRGYRAMLLYLAGAWSHRAGKQYRHRRSAEGRAHRLVRQADEAAHPAQWVKEMRPLSEDLAVVTDPVDEIAANSVAYELQRASREKHASRTRRMIEGLSQHEAPQYEAALTELGKLIGAEAWKPSGNGRCDSVWRWKNRLWMTVEAKSEHQPDGFIPHKDIRQINDQLRLLQSDVGAGAIPEGSVAILVSPRRLVDPAAIGSAEPHVYLSTPEEVLNVAGSVVEAWKDLLNRREIRRYISGCIELSWKGSALTECYLFKSLIN